MQWIRRPVGPQHQTQQNVLSVPADTPVETVVTLMVERQVSSARVVDGHGVPMGDIWLSDLLVNGDEDPIFAGLARRRWYALPEGATAGDLMGDPVSVAVGVELARDPQGQVFALSAA